MFSERFSFRTGVCKVHNNTVVDYIGILEKKSALVCSYTEIDHDFFEAG